MQEAKAAVLVFGFLIVAVIPFLALNLYRLNKNERPISSDSERAETAE